MSKIKVGVLVCMLGSIGSVSELLSRPCWSKQGMCKRDTNYSLVSCPISCGEKQRSRRGRRRTRKQLEVQTCTDIDMIKKERWVKGKSCRETRESQYRLQNLTNDLQQLMLINPAEEHDTGFVRTAADNRQLAAQLYTRACELQDAGFSLNRIAIDAKIAEFNQEPGTANATARNYAQQAYQWKAAYDQKAQELIDCECAFQEQQKQLQIIRQHVKEQEYEAEFEQEEEGQASEKAVSTGQEPIHVKEDEATDFHEPAPELEKKSEQELKEVPIEKQKETPAEKGTEVHTEEPIEATQEASELAPITYAEPIASTIETASESVPTEAITEHIPKKEPASIISSPVEPVATEVPSTALLMPEMPESSITHSTEEAPQREQVSVAEQAPQRETTEEQAEPVGTVLVETIAPVSEHSVPGVPESKGEPTATFEHVSTPANSAAVPESITAPAPAQHVYLENSASLSAPRIKKVQRSRRLSAVAARKQLMKS